MTNVFILEDDLNRQEQFRKKLKGSNLNVVIVDSVKSAKEAYLKQDVWDYMFLDHDLGGQTLVESNNENTGYQFAKWLTAKGVPSKTQIFCHSLNPNGAMNIQAILPQTILFAFPILIQELRNVG